VYLSDGKKLAEPKQQLPARRLFNKPTGATVFENLIWVLPSFPKNPSAQREAEPPKPTAAEQQPRQRGSKQEVSGEQTPSQITVPEKRTRERQREQSVEEEVVFEWMGGPPPPMSREPLPRTKKARISELIDLYHEEIHLPILWADLTPEEEAQLEQWANSLSFKELGQEIRKRQKKLDKDLRNQWPRGLAMP
jgi:hypothetical protein